jgi:iron-sulfur cluster assembly protein|tara:strand:+ start:309 stop:875 length:567 start_codon:yes stop_codon:yes gene_type:complete
MEQITKETIIGDIVEKYPETIEPLMEMGVHCVGCHVSPFESLEDGFKGHGMTDDQINDAVKKLNEVIENSSNKSSEKKIDPSKATLNVTDKAAEKIKSFLDQEKKQGLRISVVPGGCSGFKYGMELDDKAKEDDIVIEEKGIKIFMDKSSMEKLDGSKIDFVDSVQGSGFKIDNPAASSTCGCGDSFR